MKRSLRNSGRRELPLHLMLIPSIILVFIYHYLPLLGVSISFMDYNIVKSFQGSKWVGFAQFEYLFKMSSFWRAVGNTVIIAVSRIVLSLVVPLTIALLLDQIGCTPYKRIAQTIIFMPYFISWTVMGGTILELFSMSGTFNNIIAALGGERIMFLGSNFWFRKIVIASGIWKDMGYNMIIFLAAITAVNPSLHEAAMIDGCGRFRCCLYVTLPGLKPIILLMLCLSVGGILSANTDQILVMYNPTVYETVDVIGTFVYRLGMVDRRYSISAAAGLFSQTVSLFFVGISYFLAYKFSDYRIF
ncbi:MAG: ABC transporter permease subunit [Candidatus Faecivicinus sp.]|nr:ABC transporter permease subunit [Candidatus Faecivicinus sp.]